MIYVVHHCKNTKELDAVYQGKKKILVERCNNAWLDEDLLNSRKPPTWKYCEECVSNGFVNPDSPPVNRDKINKLIESRLKDK